MFFLLFLPILLFGNSISGIGFGKTVAEAKREALADIVTNIGGDIHSTFSKIQKVDNQSLVQNSREKIIKIDNSYPILLPIFSKPKYQNGKYQIEARVDSRHSHNAYISELKKLHKNILNLVREAKNSNNRDIKIDLLERAIENLESFEKYSKMARILNISPIPIISITSSTLENMIAEINFKRDGFIKFKPNEFGVEVKIDGDRNSLKLGERYEILIKLSQSGYFYIINHSITEDGESYSYLIELNYGIKGSERFVAEVPRAYANRWFSLGEFEVIEPLGDEYIEIVASSKPIRRVPRFRQVEKFGEIYYMLGGRASHNMFKLVKARGLKRVVVAKLHFKTSK